MLLKTWLSRSSLTQAEFAKRLGTSQGTIAHWALGQRMPTAQWAAKIERATGGKVRLADLLRAKRTQSEKSDG